MSFSVSLELWVCQDLAAGRIPVFLGIKNELSQGKFGYHLGAPDALRPQNSTDFQDESSGTSPDTRKRVKTNKKHRSGQSDIWNTWCCLIYAVSNMSVNIRVYVESYLFHLLIQWQQCSRVVNNCTFRN